MKKEDIFFMLQNFRQWDKDWVYYDAGLSRIKPNSQDDFINEMFERYVKQKKGPRYPDSSYENKEISWFQVGDDMVWAFNEDLEKVTKRMI